MKTSTSLLRRALALIFCASMMLTTGYADEGIPPAAEPAKNFGTISILRMVEDKPVANADVSIYRVGMVENSTPKWTEEYSKYQLTLNPKDEISYSVLPQNLQTLINKDQIPALATKKTGENGKVQFDELSDGIYLITGSRYRQGSYYYDQIPILVFIPYLTEEQNADRDLDIEVKHTTSHVPSSGGDSSPSRISRKVLKVWEDTDHEVERPESVTVQLLDGGKVIDTQVLSQDNNWRYTWTNLSRNGDYAVVEAGVPEDYSVSVRQENVTFVVTNTYEEEITDGPTPETEKPEETPVPSETPTITPNPSEPPATTTPGDEIIEDQKIPQSGLPQTGQLWMPVFLFSGCGIAFIVIGLLMKKKEEDTE